MSNNNLKSYFKLFDEKGLGLGLSQLVTYGLKKPYVRPRDSLMACLYYLPNTRNSE